MIFSLRVRLCSSIAIASFENGLIHLSVPLPSRDENCRFTIRPISSTVGEFLDALRVRNRVIKSVADDRRRSHTVADDLDIGDLPFLYTCPCKDVWKNTFFLSVMD